MLEKHPFGDFVPRKTRYLLIGSFTAKRSENDDFYDWFYSSKRNQFWPIIELTYNTKLSSKEEKQKLFKKLKFAITDIILECDRRHGNSMDNNLTNIVYNFEGINHILKTNKIETIFFSSRFVEKEFRKIFADFVRGNLSISMSTLPSPSPRFAKLTLTEKVKIYKNLLPKLPKDYAKI